MVITVIAVLLNYLLAVWFVYGGFGLAAMGLFGAGLAISLVTWFMFISLTIFIYRKPYLRGYGIFHSGWRLHLPTCREIMRLGIPVAGLTLLEAGLFAAVAILSGFIGAKSLAAAANRPTSRKVSPATGIPSRIISRQVGRCRRQPDWKIL